MILDKDGYLLKKKGTSFSTKKKVIGNVFFPKLYNGVARVRLGVLRLPKEYIGKRFRLKVEWLDDETRK